MKKRRHVVTSCGAPIPISVQCRNSTVRSRRIGNAMSGGTAFGRFTVGSAGKSVASDHFPRTDPQRHVCVRPLSYAPISAPLSIIHRGADDGRQSEYQQGRSAGFRGGRPSTIAAPARGSARQRHLALSELPLRGNPGQDAGSSTFLQVVRRVLSPLTQQPPRMTFKVPLAGPVGSRPGLAR